MTGLDATLSRARRGARLAGGAGALLLLVGLLLDREQFFRSYLFSFLFWAGLGLGSLAVLMLHSLTGGGWGLPARRVLEAGTRTLPVVALMFVPVAAGIGQLYEWSHADAVAHDPVLQHKSAYLNVPFFLGRAALYFVLWIAFARALLRLGERFEATGDPALRHRRAAAGAAGILVYFLAMTFAAIDWAMSLEAHWFSTIYGVHFIVGQVLSALCLAIVVAARVRREEPAAAEAWSREQFNDLGNLLVAFVLVWAYVSFSQYLIIWSGNLPEETPWYLHRTGGGWQAVALALVVLHFAVPFLALLARRNKRDPGRLARLAGALLLVRAIDVFWLVAPAFHPESFHLSWMDPVALVALGGFWTWHFVSNLQARPRVAPVPPAAAPAEAAS